MRSDTSLATGWLFLLERVKREMHMQEISSVQNEPQGPGRCLFSSSLPMAIHSVPAGACLLMDSPSISQTCLFWLPAVPLLLALDAGLTLERDMLSAAGIVSKSEVCRYRELMQGWQEKLSIEGGARLPCPLGRGQHGTVSQGSAHSGGCSWELDIG